MKKIDRARNISFSVIILIIFFIFLFNYEKTRLIRDDKIKTQESSYTNSESQNYDDPEPKNFWNGELIIRRSNQIISIDGSKKERVLYSTPKSDELIRAGKLSNNKVLLEIKSNKSQLNQIVIFYLDSQKTTDTDYKSLDAITLRPNNESFAQVKFSNAERDYGSTIELVKNSEKKPLYKFQTAVTALAWRADGEELAVSAQNKVVRISLNGGDSRTVELDNPVVSLNWRGSEVIALTTNQVLTIDNNLKVNHITFNDNQTIERDITPISEDSFAWLMGKQGNAEIKFSKTNENPKIITNGDQIIGFIRK